MFMALMALALPIILSSCQKEDSSDVNQDKIYSVYELFYNANTDKTVAIARFRFGTPTGTLLEVTSPASITFNGDDMPYSVAYSGHAKEYSGLLTSGTFIYTNTEGTVFTNTTPTMTTLDYPAGFDTIVKSQSNTLTWTGTALSANERANFFIGTWTWGEDALFTTSGNGANNIVMGINQLSNLALGSSTGYIDRVNESAIAQGTSEGGLIRTRYRPTNVTLEVVP